MPDRTIVWGDPADAGTKYRTQDDDPAGGGNFVVAEDTDGNTVLLQWNPDAGTAGQWEYSGPVDLGGNDLTSVGTATVDALEAGSLDSKNGWTDVTSSRSLNTTETNDTGRDLEVRVELRASSDATIIGHAHIVDGVSISRRRDVYETGDSVVIYFSVAAGSTYEIAGFADTADFAIDKWFEQ